MYTTKFVVFVLSVLVSAAPAFAQERQRPRRSANKQAQSQQVKMPGVVTDLCLGGGGHLILLHLSELKKIAVFDVSSRKIVGYIPAEEEDTMFAAGLSKAILISNSAGTISQWDLKTFQRESTQQLTLNEPVGGVLLGCNTEGPAVVSCGQSQARIYEIQLDSLKPTEVRASPNAVPGFSRECLISANGQGATHGGTMMRRLSNSWTADYEHTSSARFIPSADGRHMVCQGAVYTSDYQLRNGDEVRSLRLYPAVNSPLMLGLPTEDTNPNANATQQVNASLFLIDGVKLLASELPFEAINVGDTNQTLSTPLSRSKRTLFFPHDNLVIMVPQTVDNLTCIPFDVDSALKQAKSEYLFIDSNPRRTVQVADTFEYQVTSKSSSKNIQYRLEAGPAEMNMEPTGKLTWVASREAEPLESVLVSANDGGGQVVYQNFEIHVLGATGANAKSLKKSSGEPAPPVEAAQLASDPQFIPLPSPYAASVVGGAGRYMLLHFPDIKRIGVFDVSGAQMSGYVAAPDGALMAASRDKLLVADPTRSQITRWNLATLEKELTVSSPCAGPILSIAAGSASDGPLFVCWAAGTEALSELKFLFIDIDTLQPIEMELPQMQGRYRDNVTVRAAANGKVFTYNPGAAIELRETGARSDSGFDSYQTPSADGTYLVSNGYIKDFEGNQLTKKPDVMAGIAPAVSGNFYLYFPVFDQNDDRPKENAKLFMFGDDRPIATIPNIKLDLPVVRSSSRRILFPTERVTIVPEAKVVITGNSACDQLILNRFDVDELLDQSGIDFLIVASRPPTTVERGEHFEYQIDVKSKHGGLKYNLESGPKGMTVSTDGLVKWHAFKNWTEVQNEVIITVTDSAGQEVYHKFTLTLVEPSKTKPKNSSASRPRATPNAASVAEPKAEPKAPVFAKRTWKDSTGKHSIEAKFSMIVDNKIVVLIGDDGKERRVPLDRLSATDAKHALQCEQKRTSAK